LSYEGKCLEQRRQKTTVVEEPLMKRNQIFFLIAALVIVVFGMTGCDKGSPVNSTQVASITQASQATQDAAASISGAIGGDNGGVDAQLTDAANILAGSALQINSFPQTFRMTNTFYKYKQFNADTTWTIFIERSHSRTPGGVERSWTRKYQYWFVKNGQKQKFVTSADSAFFKIISDSCTGVFRNKHVSHKLDTLAGMWVGKLDWVNKKITINSIVPPPYTRVATDSISAGSAERVSHNTLTLTFVDVVVPFNTNMQPLALDQYVCAESGTVSGTYHADIKFVSGPNYNETTVDRTFTINFTNNPVQVGIRIRDPHQGREYSGKCNLGTGDLE
jgi:hypothetical protein